MQTIDRRKFNSGLFLGVGLASCAQLPSGAPDLVVTAIRWSEDDGATWHTGPIRAGSNVWFEADIKNQGARPTPEGVIIGVAFRANGVMCAWSDHYATALPAGQTISLRANGGPDGDKYWNNAQAGNYTLRAHVDDIDRFTESDKSNNTLDVSVTVEDAAEKHITIGMVSGGGNLYNGDSGSHKTVDLATLHCKIARVSLSPRNDYFKGNSSSPSNNDNVMVAMLQNGVQPYVSLVFHKDLDSSVTGIPNKNYADWFDIGAAFAARFRVGSAFLTGQGISGLGMYGMAAINEPDVLRGQSSITYTQYRDMLHGLADGVHSEAPKMPVWPGGYLSHDRDKEFTGHGYGTAIADLVNDGTLAGYDLHTYHSKANSPEFYSNSHQYAVDRFISECGITRADVNMICTETNVKADPVASEQGYTETTARNWFLTTMFDVWATTRSNGTWSVGPRFPWNLWRQSDYEFYMAADVSPRVEWWCGLTYSMLMGIVHDMAFVSTDPRDTGVHKLVGGGKTAWVFQNLSSSWSSIFGSTFTISDIPSGATKVDVYDGNGLVETVNTPTIPKHVFSTPTGRSYLLIADAETPAPATS